jgi:hypothetical protein
VLPVVAALQLDDLTGGILDVAQATHGRRTVHRDPVPQDEGTTPVRSVHHARFCAHSVRPCAVCCSLRPRILEVESELVLQVQQVGLVARGDGHRGQDRPLLGEHVVA